MGLLQAEYPPLPVFLRFHAQAPIEKIRRGHWILENRLRGLKSPVEKCFS